MECSGISEQCKRDQTLKTQIVLAENQLCLIIC